MEVCVNNNGSSPSFEWSGCQTAEPSTARPKRDFRFQVIEIRQCPKWFIWPSRNRRNNDEVDENHNKETKTVGMEDDYPQPVCSSQNQFVTYSSTQNGYGAIRRNVLRGSKLIQMEKDGVPGRTASEPARRVSAKKDKAATEPIAAAGSPSNTFKILSIAKKWESFDATDDESEEVIACCTQMNPADVERRWTTN